MCISVDLPEPEGPMIAVKRSRSKSTLTSRQRVDGGVALAVAAADVAGLHDVAVRRRLRLGRLCRGLL